MIALLKQATRHTHRNRASEDERLLRDDKKDQFEQPYVNINNSNDVNKETNQGNEKHASGTTCILG